MAVKKTDIDFWNKYKGFTYDQFSAWAKQNGYKSVKDIPNYETLVIVSWSKEYVAV